MRVNEKNKLSHLLILHHDEKNVKEDRKQDNYHEKRRRKVKIVEMSRGLIILLMK
jgi:hypothetical protein